MKNKRKGDERLGAASAVRMMEGLAARQERAYSRLYHFLQGYLDLSPVAHVPTSSSALSHHHHHHHRHGRQYVRQPAPTQYHQHRARFGDDDDGMDETLFAHPFVRRSLHLLRHVPAYRRHALETAAGARRSEVTRRFLLALTSGYGGAPPIEVRAHDPVAYVGDMLAFAFRGFSVEAELARGLADYDPGKEEGGGNAEDDDGDDEEEEDAAANDPDDPLLTAERPMTSSDVLSHAVSGVTRPLRSRIGQVVSSLARRADGSDGAGGGDPRRIAAAALTAGEDGLDEETSGALGRIAALYSICGLLLFYRSAFDKGMRKLESSSSRRGGGGGRRRRGSSEPPATAPPVGKGATTSNPLAGCAAQCLAEAARAYAASLRVYAAALEVPPDERRDYDDDDHHRPSSMGGGGIPRTGTSSPSDLARAAVLRICEARASSPGFVADSGGDTVGGGVGGEGDDVVMAAATESLGVDALLDALLEPAVRSFATLDDASSLKFALSAAKRAGLSAECHAKWDGILSRRERDATDKLVRSETRKVLRACGLGGVHDALLRMELEAIAEGQTCASTPGLSRREVEAAAKEFYASLYAPPLPSFEGIKDPVLRKYARRETARGVADAYRFLYEAVTDESRGGYEDLSFLGHNPDQVETLLSL